MRLSLLSTLLVLLALPAAAELVESTPAGGLWSDGATWVGGVVPEAADDVLIAGPVTVDGSPECAALTVASAGTLGGGAVPPNTLRTSGDVLNSGAITDGSGWFTLEVGGDLDNRGAWSNHSTLLAEADDRQFAMNELSTFATSLGLAADAGGEVLVTTPTRVDGNIDLPGLTIRLGASCPFPLEGGRFSADLVASGNALIFESHSYLQSAALDGVVLVGEASVSSNVTFTGLLTVMDVLQNARSAGNGHALIAGGLVNRGEIRNDQYGFTTAPYGDLHNEGTISNSYVAFEGGDVTHFVSMTPDASINTILLMPEFIPSTLVATTPLQFYGGSIGLGAGTVILEPGCDLTFVSHGGLGSSFGEGAVYANGNSISLDTYGGIGGVVIDAAVLQGHVALGGPTIFMGGVTVAGTLVNRGDGTLEAEVEGLLLNEGVILGNGGYFELHVLGDAENRGIWSNDRVVVAGEQDQAIGTGAGIDVPEFVLAAGFTAAGYQWYRDGVPLPGETAAELMLNGVGAAEYGVYQCTGAGGEISRSIVIAELNPHDDHLFADGFESGDTSAWSAVVGS